MLAISTEFESFLTRLYLDAAFRALFCKDSEAAFSFFELSGSDKRTLSSLAIDGINNFAQSLKRKRLSLILSQYPYSSKVYPSHIETILERYNFTCLRNAYHQLRDDIIQFGLFAEDFIRSSQSIPLVLSDVVRYERLAYQSKLEHKPANSKVDIEDIHLDAFVPVRSEYVKIAAFYSPIEKVILEIQSETRSNFFEMIKNSTDVGYYAIDSSGLTNKTSILSLSKQAFDLLNSCDGSMSSKQILDQLIIRSGTNISETHYKQSLKTFYDMGVLRFLR